MGNKEIYKKVRSVCKPGKLAYYRLRHIEKPYQDKLITTAAVVLAFYTFLRCFPFDGVWDFIFTVVGILLLFVVFILVLSCIMPFLLRMMSLLFAVPSMIYDACDDRINGVTRVKKIWRSKETMNKAPRAEVGIKYFIERERRIQIDHAKFLG